MVDTFEFSDPVAWTFPDPRLFAMTILGILSRISPRQKNLQESSSNLDMDFGNKARLMKEYMRMLAQDFSASPPTLIQEKKSSELLECPFLFHRLLDWQTLHLIY